METFVITIDGPSASGKSSLSRALAQHFQWKWVSTGAFYRGLAVVARRSQVDLTNAEALVELAESNIWKIQLDLDKTRVYYQQEDVTEIVYKEETGSDASIVSQIPSVRKSLLEAQRNCALGQSGLIAEGRDCGTVVFPNAQLKIYLTANSENRLERRALEEGKHDEFLRAAQIRRDQQDANRKSAPMQIPEKAIVIDTSDMTLDQVIQSTIELVGQALRKY